MDKFKFSHVDNTIHVGIYDKEKTHPSEIKKAQHKSLKCGRLLTTANNLKPMGFKEFQALIDENRICEH